MKTKIQNKKRQQNEAYTTVQVKLQIKFKSHLQNQFFLIDRRNIYSKIQNKNNNRPANTNQTIKRNIQYKNACCRFRKKII